MHQNSKQIAMSAVEHYGGRLLLALLAFLMLPVRTGAQDAGTDPQETNRIRIQRASSPIVLDGLLGEAAFLTGTPLAWSWTRLTAGPMAFCLV